MRESTRNFLVGLTAIISLLALGTLLFLFGELEPLFRSRYAMTIWLNNAAGLRQGSQVVFNGVPIGVIEKVQVVPDTEYPVKVTARISEGVKIPASAQPNVNVPLIGGGSTLSLDVQPAEPGQTVAFIPDDGTAELHGTYRSMMQQITDQLSGRMQPLIDSLEKFAKLSETYSSLGDNLNELVKTQDPAAVAAGTEAPNLRTAAQKLNKALDDIDAALALAKQWLGDEQLRADAKAAVENASALIEKAAAAVERYTHLAERLETNAADITGKLLPLADQLAGTLEDVRRVTKSATEGTGSISLMLNNPDLYNSLTESAVRLERVLIEVQLLIEKLKAEGVQIKL
jgi:phospholipid/cholesterol/gamma-HCH transport system substrate-binding protein